LKPAWANSLKDPISKMPITKKAGGVVRGEGPEFKPYITATSFKIRDRIMFLSISNFEAIHGYFVKQELFL
jgi:hypothetical protein